MTRFELLASDPNVKLGPLLKNSQFSDYVNALEKSLPFVLLETPVCPKALLEAQYVAACGLVGITDLDSLVLQNVIDELSAYPYADTYMEISLLTLKEFYQLPPGFSDEECAAIAAQSFTIRDTLDQRPAILFRRLLRRIGYYQT